VRRIGIRRRAGGITVFAAPGRAERPRAAFVAGRGVGPAVQRNRAKRRLREAFGRIPLREDRDYVVVATAEVTEAPFEDLIRWLTRAVTAEED
jgi:ribonuclease P protein component